MRLQLLGNDFILLSLKKCETGKNLFLKYDQKKWFIRIRYKPYPDKPFTRFG